MYSVVVLAAGSGSRMGLGYNKIFYSLAGKPVIVHTLQKFKADLACREIVVVTNDSDAMHELLRDNLFIDAGKAQTLKIVSGGAERQDSVYQGLLAVTSEAVLVHDGARPFVDLGMVQNLLNAVATGDAAIVGVPVKDTIKRVASGKVLETLKREELYAVQTPQAAPVKLLREAHEQAQLDGFLGTDEASLIEKYTDAVVRMVEGSYRNIKLTTPEDLLLAERLLQEE